MMNFDDPRTQALLAMGLGTMAASGPSPVKQGLLPILGQAGLGAMGIYQDLMKRRAEQAALDKEMGLKERGLEMDNRRLDLMNNELDLRSKELTARSDAQRAEAEQGSRYAQSILGSPAMAQLAVQQQQFRPEQLGAIARMASAPTSGIADNAAQTLFSAPPAIDIPKEVSILQAAGIDPRSQQGQKALLGTMARAPVAQVNVDTGAKEQDKTLNKWYGDQFAKIQETGISADKRLNDYRRLGDLLNQVETRGAGGEFIMNAKKWAKTAGVDLAALGIKDDTAPAEAAMALKNEMVFRMQAPGGPMDSPGALSNTDRDYIDRVLAGLTTTPGGADLMIETATRIAQREKDIAKLARQYMAKNGGLMDEGFYDELAKFSEANPLFDDLSAKSSADKKAAAVSDADIDATAQKYGMTREQVIQKLKEAGYGP